MRLQQEGTLVVFLLSLLTLISIIEISDVLNPYLYFHFANSGNAKEVGQLQNNVSSTEVNKQAVKLLCNETNEIVETVYSRALQNETDAIAWQQSGAFLFLTCEQLARSLSTTRNNYNENVTNNNTARSDDAEVEIELDHNLAMRRLSEKLSKLKLKDEKSAVTADPSLKIVVIGGSMSTGWVDYSTVNNADVANVAWPRKLEQFMHQKWHKSSVQVINLALGGANEDTWLGRLDVIMEYAPDIILVESAVNDESDYHEQTSIADHVNRTSYLLLNILMNFPTEPAVINVELFRIAHHNVRDANRHCRGHVGEVVTSEACLYCEQWWKPQSWRKDARELNLVSSISYRDAVWPILSQPPKELCQYWSGLSHPESGVHAMVASTILFQFMVVMQKKDAFLELSKQKQKWGGGNKNAANVLLHQASIPENVCLSHISSFRAVQGDPNDAFLGDISSSNSGNSEYTHANSCWKFRVDVRDKYGWICEESRNRTIVDSSDDVEANTRSINGGGETTNNFLHRNQDEYLHLYKKVRIGKHRRVIISRLVSYDERMAIAQVWFSSSESEPTVNKNHSNIFIGDPVWNITSWHKEKNSIPQPYVIQLSGLDFKESLNMFTDTSADAVLESNGSSSGAFSSTSEVIFNLKLLVGSSKSRQIDGAGKITAGVDKFKLLGIVTC